MLIIASQKKPFPRPELELPPKSKCSKPRMKFKRHSRRKKKSRLKKFSQLKKNSQLLTKTQKPRLRPKLK